MQSALSERRKVPQVDEVQVPERVQRAGLHKAEEGEEEEERPEKEEEEEEDEEQEKGQLGAAVPGGVSGQVHAGQPWQGDHHYSILPLVYNFSELSNLLLLVWKSRKQN